MGHVFSTEDLRWDGRRLIGPKNKVMCAVVPDVKWPRMDAAKYRALEILNRQS